jgi:cytochrome c oxidase subunit II
MLLRTAATRRIGRMAPVLCALALVLAGCTPDHYPQTALRPLSDFGRIGDHIQTTTFKWAVLVFILVEGALLYAIFRFRGKPDDPEPKQVHGNTTVEIIWTVIPALILAAIAVPTVRGIFETAETPGADALEIQVIGHQWWWEFRYPSLNVTTANELHVPVGQTVSLKMKTADVVHSFWNPRISSGKRDVFPNRETRLWFKAEQEGEYPGQCAEFCGIQHGRMGFRVKAQSADDFKSWGAHMQSLTAKPPAAATAEPKDTVRNASVGATVQAPAETGALYAQGEKLFTAKGCIGCHSLVAYQAPQGMIGPNLANVGARTYIAAATLKNTDDNLAHWIMNPQGIKEGVLMPNLGVKPEEAKALAAYLRAHQ